MKIAGYCTRKRGTRERCSLLGRPGSRTRRQETPYAQLLRDVFLIVLDYPVPWPGHSTDVGEQPVHGGPECPDHRRSKSSANGAVSDDHSNTREQATSVSPESSTSDGVSKGLKLRHYRRPSLGAPEVKKRSGAEWETMKLELGSVPDFEGCFFTCLEIL